MLAAWSSLLPGQSILFLGSSGSWKVLKLNCSSLSMALQNNNQTKHTYSRYLPQIHTRIFNQTTIVKTAPSEPVTEASMQGPLDKHLSLSVVFRAQALGPALQKPVLVPHRAWPPDSPPDSSQGLKVTFLMLSVLLCPSAGRWGLLSHIDTDLPSERRG